MHKNVYLYIVDFRSENRP